jgi:cytochrome c oxidase cbb3-type subunit III
MSLRSEVAAHRRLCVRGLASGGVTLLAALLLAACEREERNFTTAQSADEAAPPISGYDESAYAVGEGKRLYVWFNCIGCHAMGGGGMGPPLMDQEWRYGSEPDEIFATIMDGRRNGMPSFRGRIPEQYAWRLVAYVRSMSGLVLQDRRPGRSDDIHVKAPELLRERVEPRTVGPPPLIPGAEDTVIRIRAGGES